MILHAQAKQGQTGFPWLVFLHGFSGDCREWQTVGEAFKNYSRLYIDLPGHGGSADISVNGFDDVSALLRNTLLSYNILKFLADRLLSWRQSRDDGGLSGDARTVRSGG
ncbi:acyl-CoA thioester hydrolase YfbB [Citrobacter freundii]|nr:acyl-CoA thioester hydrolase YfbB [Citrobacter freundii]